MMKKIAAAILSAVLAVSALPVNRSSAASDYQFSYVVVEGGIKITEGVGSGEKLEIPSEYEGCTVVAIGDNAFDGMSGLTTVVIPDTVKSIGSKAFFSCSKLESLTIGNGTTAIGDSAFSGCLSLDRVTLPDSVETLGKNCFTGCLKLESVRLSDNIKAVPENCFSACTSLASLSIPDSVTRVGANACDSCGELSMIYVPPTVTEIGDNSIGRRYDTISASFANISGFTIACEKNSAAYTYAEELGITIADTADYIGGDADLNGKLLTDDALLVLDEYKSVASGKLPSFSGLQVHLADLDGDNSVTAIDAALILRKYSETQSGT